MARRSQQRVELACVDLSSAAISGLYCAGVLAGSFQCLVGLALEMVLFFSQDGVV